MYWSTVRGRTSAPLPVLVFRVGMSRASGMKRERMRFQSRGWPAGPEMTSYSAARMASTEWTSAGLALGQSGCAAMEVGSGVLAAGVLDGDVLPAGVLADWASAVQPSSGKSARAVKRVRTMRGTVSHAVAALTLSRGGGVPVPHHGRACVP